MDERQTLNEVPFKVYNNVHKSDIFDICWSPKNENLVITASSDTTLALYNIQMEKPL